MRDDLSNLVQSRCDKNDVCYLSDVDITRLASALLGRDVVYQCPISSTKDKKLYKISISRFDGWDSTGEKEVFIKLTEDECNCISIIFDALYDGEYYRLCITEVSILCQE